MTTLPELQQRASALFRKGGDPAEAIAAYERLLAHEERLPNSWFNLAILLRRARRPQDALDAYRCALDNGVADAEEVHLQRGVIFSDDLGQSDAARAELGAALSLNPDYVPALLNLGNLNEDCGNWPAARAAYARALELDPGNALALARLASIAGDAEDYPALVARLEAQLAGPTSSAQDRADLGFALGALLDRIGDYDRAFAAYEVANAASRAIATASRTRYDRRAQEQLIERLMSAFPEQTAPTLDASGTAPVFICGMFRSGSTLVEQILGRHSRVVTGGELDALPAAIDARLRGYPESATSLTEPDVAGLRQSYLATIAGRASRDVIFTDKRPDNFLHIGLIKRMFPDARIVHTTRDPLDNCLSAYFLHASAELGYTTDLGDIGHYYTQYRKLMAHWHGRYGDDILEMNYDRLVDDPEREIARLLGYCGLDWESAVLDPAGSTSAVRTASHWQVRQPLYRASSGRWRHYSRHLGPLHKAL